MLDGQPVLPEIYSHTQIVDKMDVVSQPQLNNNDASIANRNSSTMLASPNQVFYIMEVSVPRMDCNALHGSIDTNSTKYISEQIQPSRDTLNMPLQAPEPYNPFKTDDSNMSPQVNDETVPKTAEKDMFLGTWRQQSNQQHVQTSTDVVEEADELTDMAAVVTKIKERRPMNAFLLFCKRHRPVLKKEFVEENREITKKLGKWWKMLTPEQQEPYQELAEKYKTEYLNVNPGFRWCKTATTASSAGADSSLNERKTDWIPVESELDAISQDRLEAAQALVRLGGCVDHCNPLTWKMADVSQMGSLRELFNDKRADLQPTEDDDERKIINSFTSAFDVGQPGESQSSRVSAPVPCASEVGKPQDQAGDGAEHTTRTERSCKGNRYKGIMEHIYPRAQSKRATCSKKTPKVLNGGASTASDRTTDMGCVAELTEVEAKIKRLETERDKELSNIPAMSIDQFIAIQHSEKRRKKSKRSAAKALIKVAILPGASSDIQAPMEAPENDHSISAPDSNVPMMAPIEQPVNKPIGCRKRKPPRSRITRLDV